MAQPVQTTTLQRQSRSENPRSCSHPFLTTRQKAKVVPKKPAPASKPKAPPKKTIQTTLKTKTVVPKKRSKLISEDENSDNDVPSHNDDSLLSNTPPSSKKQKLVPAKKSGGRPLEQIDNESYSMDGTVDEKPAKAKKSGTEQYQKVRSAADH